MKYLNWVRKPFGVPLGELVALLVIGAILVVAIPIWVVVFSVMWLFGFETDEIFS